jgi:hypothetical protein
MKNIMLLLVPALLILSCNQQPSGAIEKLTGKYAVLGFKVKSDMDKNGGKLIHILDKKREVFEFRSDGEVIIGTELGETYFSGTNFRYELTGKTLSLYGHYSDRVIPYRRDGEILNLCINSNGIDTLQIAPVKILTMK